MLSDKTLVIGNGESRKNINLDLIHCTKYGCNAIFRDHYVDHLICVDSRMVDEALVSLKKISKIYTRTDWINNYEQFPQVKVVPNLPYAGTNREDDPWHWGSGPYAVLLAALDYPSTVEMIGFDLYGIDGKVNNVYKGTQNYSKSDSHAIDHSYWVYQISKVFESFPDKYFVVYNKSDWQIPRQWDLENVVVKDIDIFNATL